MNKFNPKGRYTLRCLWLALVSTALLLGGCSMAPLTVQNGKPAATDVLEAWKQADRHYARGQFSEARKGYRVVRERQPDNAGVLLKLANIAYYLQEHDLARDLYGEIEATGDANPRFYYNRAALNLTAAYRDLAQYGDEVGSAGTPNEIRAVMAAIERLSRTNSPKSAKTSLSPLEGEEAL